MEIKAADNSFSSYEDFKTESNMKSVTVIHRMSVFRNCHFELFIHDIDE